jgi:hypothetical protein
MAITNQERVGKAMEMARMGLARFVEGEFPSTINASSISMDLVYRFADDPSPGQKTTVRWDVAALLRLMWGAKNARSGKLRR